MALLYTNTPVFTAPNGAPLGAVHTGVSDMAFPMKTNRTLVFFYKVKQNKAIFLSYLQRNIYGIVQINEWYKNFLENRL